MIQFCGGNATFDEGGGGNGILRRLDGNCVQDNFPGELQLACKANDARFFVLFDLVQNQTIPDDDAIIEPSSGNVDDFVTTTTSDSLATVLIVRSYAFPAKRA
jgi:hypothetical protein